MFSKATLFIASALVAFASAGPARRGETGGIPAGECTTAPVQCCNSVEHGPDFSPTSLGLFSVLNVLVEDITAAVGVTCNPITGIGLGSVGCAAHPVCCEHNDFGGVFALGCIPVNLDL